MNNFWRKQASRYTDLLQSSLVETLHPVILNYIRDSNPNTLLDFGCGDGRLIERLDRKIEVTAYDSSSEMIELAKERLPNREVRWTTDASVLLKEHYDVAVCSIVLECVPKKEDVRRELQLIYTCIKPDGFFLFGNTHPCFRKEQFSDFRTEYSIDKVFNYFRLDDGFYVEVLEGKKHVRFKDYHRPVSFYINECLHIGFILEQLIEVRDNSKHPAYNKLVSPYLLQVYCKKSSVLKE